MVEDDDSDREEEEGHPFHQGMPPGFPPGFGGLGGLGGLPMMPGMHLGGGMTLKICWLSEYVMYLMLFKKGIDGACIRGN